MSYNTQIGQDLLNVPMGKMIKDMAFAIAEAQTRLDENSITVAEMMGGLKTIYNKEGETTFEDSRVFFGRDQVPLSVAKVLYSSSANKDGEKSLIINEINRTSSKVTVKSDASGNKLIVDSTNSTLEPGEDPLVFVPARLSMLELGFTPNFYQFVDTIIEVKISISYKKEDTRIDTRRNSSSHENKSFGGYSNWWYRNYHYNQGKSVSVSQVNASYATKYNYSAEGASLLRTKLSPVPPPAILEERIRNMMLIERELLQQEVEKNEGPKSLKKK
ncbi:hypothetical protein ABW636_04895 [Aquimarina sp. 2201CG1-2-11]|uniref:hypothetical protein n=1 Tax=Aquimarina discodermiae TaxID=3231043 RepID=UPI00346202ED